MGGALRHCQSNTLINEVRWVPTGVTEMALGFLPSGLLTETHGARRLGKMEPLECARIRRPCCHDAGLSRSLLALLCCICSLFPEGLGTQNEALLLHMRSIFTIRHPGGTFFFIIEVFQVNSKEVETGN